MVNGGKVSDDGTAVLVDEVDEDLLLEFLNTIDLEDGTDEIRTADAYRDWAAQRSLEPGDWAAALELRDCLRRLAAGEPVRLPDVPVRAAATGHGVAIEAATIAEAVMASVLILGIRGRLPRLKLCLAHTCRYAFIDHSRNGSRTWCEMGICGNRAKARAYRSRRDADTP